MEAPGGDRGAGVRRMAGGPNGDRDGDVGDEKAA